MTILKFRLDSRSLTLPIICINFLSTIICFLLHGRCYSHFNRSAQLLTSRANTFDAGFLFVYLFCFVFAILGLELRTFTLSYSVSPFCDGCF
jgi:hypothetical protein